jgi:hypothetical protein
MSDAQKPSIGRIVHYFDSDAERVFAAVIVDTLAEDADLSSETHVNLHSFGSREFDPDDAFDVPYSEKATKRHRWYWPPRV